MGDGQHTPTGLFLVGRHEGPEILSVFRIEGGERKDLVRQGFVIPEDHDTVEVAAAGLAGPLVADQAGEGAGVVVALGHRVVHLPDIGHVGVVGDQGLRSLGHPLDKQIEGFPALARLEQVVEFLTQRRLEQFRVGGLEALGEAKVLGMVGHHQEIKWALQSRLLAGVAGDGLTAGKAIGLVQAQLGAGQTGIRRQGRVQVGVTEIGTVAAHALGLRTGACRCRGLAAEPRPRIIAAGGQSREQGDDA